MPRPLWPAAERIAAAAVSVVLLIAAAPGGVQVRVSEGRVDIVATAAPVAEILDALAAQTGMRIEYEGSPPRQLLSLALHDRTPVEAVLGVLDGQPVDYALQLDSARSGVRLLLITSASGSTGRRPRPPSNEPPPAPEPPMGQPFEQIFDEPTTEEPPQDEVQEAPTAPPAGFPGAPGGGRPGRPSAGPLLFPSPLMLPTPTPSP